MMLTLTANDDREEDNECSLHVHAELTMLIDGITCLHDHSAEAEWMEMWKAAVTGSCIIVGMQSTAALRSSTADSCRSVAASIIFLTHNILLGFPRRLSTEG